MASIPLRRIECVRGDITQQPDIDAIVNAANAMLLPGGGVSGAIHKAAGPGLARACQECAPIEVGAAVATPAFNLPNKYVIHAVGPRWGVDEPAEFLLSSAYFAALELANNTGVKSVAFPLISAGIYGYPLGDAMRVAIDASRAALNRHQTIERVRFVLFDSRSFDLFGASLRAMPPTH